MIELMGVHFSYRTGSKLLRGCSLSVAGGEVVAVAGPNGSGKSTLLRLASGLMVAREGEILLDGKPVIEWDRIERAKKLAYVPQKSRVPEEWRVHEVAALGDFPYQESPPAHSSLRKRLIRVKETLRLEKVWERKLVTLSGGEAQRASLARAFVQETDNLVLDEPAAHLDISYQMSVYRLFSELAADGRSILIATHDINLSRLFGQRLVILNGDGVVKPFPQDREGQSRLLEEAFSLSFVSKKITGVDCWFPDPAPFRGPLSRKG